MTSGSCFEVLEISENVTHSFTAATHQKAGFMYKVSEVLCASSFSYHPAVLEVEKILSVFERQVSVCLPADFSQSF